MEGKKMKAKNGRQKIQALDKFTADCAVLQSCLI